jgi:hypothetical protein
MAWQQHAVFAGGGAAPPAPPNTDSLLSRFGLYAGDEVMGRFLVGKVGNKHRWYRGVRAGMGWPPG